MVVLSVFNFPDGAESAVTARPVESGAEGAGVSDCSDCPVLADCGPLDAGVGLAELADDWLACAA